MPSDSSRTFCQNYGFSLRFLSLEKARIGNAIGITRANRPGSFDVYLIITAYSVTSAFTTDGDCVTISATPVTLPSPFSVVSGPEPSATDLERAQSVIESKFVTWLHRAPTCSIAPRMCLESGCLFGDEPQNTEESGGAVSLRSSYQIKVQL